MALEVEEEEGERYESSFKTFDAGDYSSIGKKFKKTPEASFLKHFRSSLILVLTAKSMLGHLWADFHCICLLKAH